MRKYQSFSKIDGNIVRAALQTAKSVIERIQRGNSEEEDIVIELIEYGLQLEKTYTPREGYTFSGYLNKYMQWKGNDIAKRYRQKGRNFICRIDESNEKRWKSYSRELGLARRLACEEIKQIIENELDDEEKVLACALVYCKPIDAEKSLGWSHGKTNRMLDKLRKKFRKVKISGLF